MISKKVFSYKNNCNFVKNENIQKNKIENNYETGQFFRKNNLVGKFLKPFIYSAKFGLNYCTITYRPYVEEFSTTENVKSFHVQVNKISQATAQKILLNSVDNQIIRRQAAVETASATPANILKGFGSGLVVTYVKTSSYVDMRQYLIQHEMSTIGAGVISGAFSALVSTPFRNWNVLIRTSDNLSLKTRLALFPVCRSDALRGTAMYMVRDAKFSACYEIFLKATIYQLVPDNVKNNPDLEHKQKFSKLICGGISGALSSLVTTPIAVVLTESVHKKLSAPDALKKVLARDSSMGKTYGLKAQYIENLYAGGAWGILRMSIVGAFYAYAMKNESLGFPSKE